MSKIGILGGTFNPIHNGHIMIAKEALKQYELDKVLVMPNHHPKYRTIDGAEDSDRSSMVKLAIESIDGLEYSDIEIAREGATYTVDTLTELHQMYPGDEFYFIMGADSLMYFDKWREPDRIVELAYLLVAIRGEDDRDTCLNKRDTLPYKDKILMLDSPNMPISSSEIRECVRAGEDISDLVPAPVREYIIKHNMYI